MKKVLCAAAIIAVIFTGCSLYHLQTPETVPQGKIAGGAGLAGVVVEGYPLAIPGFWIRAGIAPNADIGVHTWGLGMKVDGKYQFNDYFALGAGGGAAFLGALFYTVEGSVYGGIPAGVFYPYGVARLTLGGVAADVVDEYEWAGGSIASGVVGLRLRFNDILSIYGEGGLGLGLGGSTSGGGSTGAGEPGFIFGFGVSVGH